MKNIIFFIFSTLALTAQAQDKNLLSQTQIAQIGDIVFQVLSTEDYAGLKL